MSVHVDIEYLGGLKTRAVHGPSGSELLTSAPKDNMGDGSAFSPTDLAATALGTCIITTMAIAATKHGIELKGARVSLEKHMTTEGPRRLARVPVVVTLPASVPEEMRARLEAAGNACPVHRTFRDDVEMPISYRWED
jgi:uncharacterized OsmC-like protein